MPRRLVYLAYTLSGAAALVYEVTWTRLLTLHMGHTVAAASTVLAAFMGGLAIGATLAGGRATRATRAGALRLFAGCEITIGVLALALPFLVRAFRPLLATAYADGSGGSGFGAVRLLASLAVLTVPAIAMGATLPFISRWLVGAARTAGRDAGLLYAFNTLGAATGALAAGFVLLPALGLARTTLIGGLLNAGAAAVAWVVATRTPRDVQAPAAVAAGSPRSPAKGGPPRGGTARPPADPLVGGRPRVAALAVAATGAMSLALQIAWTRILALIMGPTTFAFSTIVSTFIAGIAIGSAIGSRVASRSRTPVLWLAVAMAAATAGAFGATAWAGRTPLAIANLVSGPDVAFSTVLWRQSMLTVGLLLPMTIAFGAAFPLAVAVAVRRDADVAASIAAVYAANTVGAIAGAMLGGFVLVPQLGLHGTVTVVGLVGLAIAALVVWIGGLPRDARLAGLAACLAAGLALPWLPAWDHELLSSGAYKYAPYLRDARSRAAALRAGELLFYREGAAATVAVRRLTGTTSLSIDGKVDASNGGDMLTQKLLAHVPLLLHPDPRHVAVIGLGSGVTLGSALRHPIAGADMLEISPEVVEASAFFRAENHDALADRRTRLIIGDGRSHLLLSRRTYDVIISEPSNPWMAGVASLFTREFFEAARRRLAPGGILCQWAHTYDISSDDLRSIVGTFRSVFPDGSLWLIGDGDVLLIGSTGPVEPLLAGLPRALARPGVAADLADVGIEQPFELLTLFAAGPAALARYAGDAPLQTDDRTALEFSAPRGIYGRTVGDNAARLRALAAEEELPAFIRAARAGADAVAWRRAGQMEMKVSAYAAAFDRFARALALDPRDAAALEGLVEAAAGGRLGAAARDRLEALRAADAGNVPVRVALSHLVASEGDLDGAERVATEALAANPASVPALEQLASIYADGGSPERLLPVVSRLTALAPDGEGTLYYQASVDFLQGRFAAAATRARALVSRHPGHARGQNLLGAAAASLGQIEVARTAFRASLAADPRDPGTYTNLGMLEMESGRPTVAADYFAEALTLDPANAPALEGLAASSAAR